MLSIAPTGAREHGASVSITHISCDPRGEATLGAIMQTLTLAIVLLIVGLSCLTIGAAGLIWRAGRDRRLREQAEEESRSRELAVPSSRQ